MTRASVGAMTRPSRQRFADNNRGARKPWRTVGWLALSALLVAGLAGCRGHNNAMLKTPRRVSAAGRERGRPRPIFVMSVIPGGAFTIGELRQRVKSDPVVRRSYGALAAQLGDPSLLDHVRVVQVPRDTSMHTQLRDGDKLSWSRKPITVRKGETAFAHEKTGALVARSRCGNALLPTLPPKAVTSAAPPDDATVPEKPEVTARPPSDEPEQPDTPSQDSPPVAGKDDSSEPPAEAPTAETPLVETPTAETPLVESPPVEICEAPGVDLPPTVIWDSTVPGASPELPPIATLPGGGTPVPESGGGWIAGPGPGVPGLPPGATPVPPWVPWAIGGATVLVPLIDGGKTTPAPSDEETLPPATPEVPARLLLAAGLGAALCVRVCVARSRRHGTVSE